MDFAHIIAGKCSASANSLSLTAIYKQADKHVYDTLKEIPISKLLYGMVDACTDSNEFEEGSDHAKSKGVRSLQKIIQVTVIGADSIAAMIAALKVTSETTVRDQEWADLDTGDGSGMGNQARHIWSCSLTRYSQDKGERRVFDLMLGSRNVRFIERVLGEYREVFGGRRVMKIHVLRGFPEMKKFDDHEVGWWHLIVEIGVGEDGGGGEVVYKEFDGGDVAPWS